MTCNYHVSQYFLCSLTKLKKKSTAWDFKVDSGKVHPGLWSDWQGCIIRTVGSLYRNIIGTYLSDWQSQPVSGLEGAALWPVEYYTWVTTPTSVWAGCMFGVPSRGYNPFSHVDRIWLSLPSNEDATGVTITSILCGVPCWGCNPGHVVHWTGCQPRPVAIMANVTTLNNTTDFGANLAGRGVQPGLSSCWVGRTPHPCLSWPRLQPRSESILNTGRPI